MGAESGAAACVESVSPKKEAMRALPFLIGRNHQWPGMWAAVRLIVAARSPVRLRQLSSLEQRAA